MHVGFVNSPDELRDRIDGIDRAIKSLGKDIRRSKAPKLDAKWRGAFGIFASKWSVTRDRFWSYGARMFATRIEPYLDDFEAAYLRWAKAYQERTGLAPSPVPARAAHADPPWTTWALAIGGILILARGLRR